jgi:hypothetical protein
MAKIRCARAGGSPGERERALDERKSTRAVTAACLGFVLPGAGHLRLGRRGRGWTFLGAIGVLFALGVAMDSRLEMHLGLDDPLAFLLSLAQMGAGSFYLVARILGYSAGEVTSPTFEYGNTLTAVAGLLNALVVIDAFDIGIGRKP